MGDGMKRYNLGNTSNARGDIGMPAMTLEDAIELESHYISASKSLKCACRKLKKLNLSYPFLETEAAAKDAQRAAGVLRKWITDNTKRVKE